MTGKTEPNRQTQVIMETELNRQTQVTMQTEPNRQTEPEPEDCGGTLNQGDYMVVEDVGGLVGCRWARGGLNTVTIWL